MNYARLSLDTFKALDRLKDWGKMHEEINKI